MTPVPIDKMGFTLDSESQTSERYCHNGKQDPKTGRSLRSACTRKIVLRRRCAHPNDASTRIRNLNEIGNLPRSTHWKPKLEYSNIHNDKQKPERGARQQDAATMTVSPQE